MLIYQYTNVAMHQCTIYDYISIQICHYSNILMY